MFKSILNTLQKNVIGATIFGKLPTMTTPAEEAMPAEPIPLIDVNDHPITLTTLNSSAEETDSTVDVLVECDDPLSDPLALDDSSTSVDVESVNPTLADLDTSADGQIILIDVNILRKAEQNELLNSREMETEDLSETIEEGVRSDGSDSGLASDGSIVEVRPQISEIVSKRSCLKRRSSEPLPSDNAKRVKRNVKFDGVNVFYFQRMQGNSCVPSQGGCTLGMARHHMHNRTFSLAEHASEQRRVHRLQDINTNNSSTDDTDTEDEPSENSGSDLDTESNGFLQPVPARQRRVMLKTAGVLKIDSNEKDECRVIRTSREICGCNCRGYCDPDTCFCSQSGIQCQVDRSNFPCGCTRHGCDNVVGRVEFDPERVRIHFIHTILRLELENKQNRSEEILFKNDVSRQWHPQTRPPDITTTNTISDFSHCNYSPVVFDNLSHRTALPSTDGIKDYVESLPSHHQENSNLIELAIRPSDDDTLNLHYDYRNEYNSTDSIINSNVVADDIGDQPNYEKLYTNHDANAVNSFNSTFSEFVERSYTLGATDYQQHSTYLSSSHSGSTSSGIVNNSSSIDSTEDDVNDEVIPNSDIIYSSMDNVKKPIDVTSLLENEGEFHTNNVINSNGTQMDGSLPIRTVNSLLNNDTDVEQEIPSVLVNIEKQKIINSVSNDIEENDLKSVCVEEQENVSKSISVEEEDNVSKSVCVKEEENVSKSVCVKEEENVSKSVCDEKEENVSKSVCVKEEENVSKSVCDEKEENVSKSVCVKEEENVSKSVCVKEEENVSKSVCDEKEESVSKSVCVKEEENVSRSVCDEKEEQLSADKNELNNL